MNAVETHIRNLVEIELAAANEQFPQFHSAHEGYAVMLEELDELVNETKLAQIYMGLLWENIKGDAFCDEDVKDVLKHAVNAACEAIQVAAMCEKFLEMEEKK